MWAFSGHVQAHMSKGLPRAAWPVQPEGITSPSIKGQKWQYLGHSCSVKPPAGTMRYASCLFFVMLI
jgi:hypothetical protein